MTFTTIYTIATAVQTLDRFNENALEVLHDAFATFADPGPDGDRFSESAETLATNWPAGLVDLLFAGLVNEGIENAQEVWDYVKGLR